MFAGPTGVKQEANFVLFTIDRQKYAAFILPSPARPALIGVLSMALTRERRMKSNCASWIGSSSAIALGMGLVS